MVFRALQQIWLRGREPGTHPLVARNHVEEAIGFCVEVFNVDVLFRHMPRWEKMIESERELSGCW